MRSKYTWVYKEKSEAPVDRCYLTIKMNTLAFLDLQITISNQKLHYPIFRKPNFTDTVISFSSNHPTTTKFAAFYSMFHRLLSIPMNNTNFNKELNIIQNIALNNGYNISTINKIYNKMKRKFTFSYIHSLQSGIEQIFRRIPFISNQLTSPLASTLRSYMESLLLYITTTI